MKGFCAAIYKASSEFREEAIDNSSDLRWKEEGERFLGGSKDPFLVLFHGQ